MVKLVVAYKKPEDVPEFERLYKDEHLALAARIPKVAKVGLGKSLGTPDGSPGPYHRIAELYFADMDDLGGAAASDEGKAALSHAHKIATGGVDIMIIDVERDS